MFATDAASAGESPLADLAAAGALVNDCVPASGTAEMLAQVRALRELSSVVAAAEAAVTASFVAARRAEQVAAGMPARRVGQGIPRELGLARRESPNRAGRYAGFAGVLVRELPATFAALRAGVTSEWRAVLVAKETGWLSAGDRLAVDAEVGPRLHALGDREVGAEAAKIAYRIDPYGKLAQLRRAVGGRRVGLLPADDGMSKLIATLPLAQGVAVIAALNRAADTARSAGDERSRGQVMADTLVELVTGQRTAEGVPLRVDLLITGSALLATGPGAGEPASLGGVPLPAPCAREFIAQTAAAAGADSAAMVKNRRLFTDPAGRLVTMETSSRDFTPGMAAFVRLRDQWCTTPYCGAPIRHIDHLWPWAQGGPTSLTNSQGLCEACNYARQAPGWRTTRLAEGTVTTTLPTGHEASTFTEPRQPTPTRPDVGHPVCRTTYRHGTHPRPRARPAPRARPTPGDRARPPDNRSPGRISVRQLLRLSSQLEGDRALPSRLRG